MPTRFCALLFLSLPMAAQVTATTWENMKTLSPGSELRVNSTASGKPIQGRLQSVSDGELALKRGSHVQSFLRTEIVRVSVRQKGRRRLRNTLIGMGAGTAAGALIGLAIGHHEASSCQKANGGWCGLDTAAGAAVGGLGGLVSGGILGAFWRSGGWTDIYVR
jgi:hypothetical protein